MYFFVVASEVELSIMIEGRIFIINNLTYVDVPIRTRYIIRLSVCEESAESTQQHHRSTQQTAF